MSHKILNGEGPLGEVHYFAPNALIKISKIELFYYN